MLIESIQLYLKFMIVKTSFIYKYVMQEKGLHGLPRLVIFTSEDSHYSIQKLAAFEGLGSENVYSVKTDSRGKVDIKDLEKRVLESIAEKAVPFMVSATSGKKIVLISIYCPQFY